MRFRDPSGLWRVLLCGGAAFGILRSGVVRGSGLAGPARVLIELRERYAEELGQVDQVANAQEAKAAVDGLAWSDKEALGQMSIVIAARDTEAERRRLAHEIARIAKTDMADDLRFLALATALRKRYGAAIFDEAAEQIRGARRSAVTGPEPRRAN